MNHFGTLWNSGEGAGGKMSAFGIVAKNAQANSLRHCTMKWLLHNEVAFSEKPL
jgi:hypothetical protein